MFKRLAEFVSGLAAVAMVAAMPAVVPAQDRAPAPGAADISGGKSDEESKGLQIVMGRLIPEGKPILNATIPDLVKGVLKTLVKAASITRLDDDTLRMVAMEIEMYNDEGEPDLSISMETATFDMPTGVLESDRPTQLSNDQFDLWGESFLYDSKTRQGKLFGHVTMYLYNLEGKMNEEKPDTDNE